MTVLLTAFEPFGGNSINAAQAAVDLVDTTIGDHEIVKRTLPVSFRQAPIALDRAIAEVHPQAVVMVGQAPRQAVCLERVALNLMLAKGADNDGFRPAGIPVVPDAPTAYMTRVPVDDIADSLHGIGLPVQVSNSAGLFVCNTLYYKTMYKHPDILSLFVHVPKIETMPSDIAAQVLTNVIATAFCDRCAF